MPTEPDEGPQTGPDEIERQLLEAAVAEALASGPPIPHAVVRQRMLAMIAEARARMAERLREDHGSAAR